MDGDIRELSLTAAARPVTAAREEGYCALEWPTLGLATCGRDMDSAERRLPEALRGLADTYAGEPDQRLALREYLDACGAEYALTAVDGAPEPDGVFPLEGAGPGLGDRRVRCRLSLAVPG